MTLFSSLISVCLQYVAWNLCVRDGLTISIFVTSFTLFVLESRTKMSILREPYNKLSSEETAGFFEVFFFWWINKILKMGYCKNFGLADMPALDESLDALKIRVAMQREWNKRCTLVVSLNPSLNSNEPRATRRSFLSDVGTVYVFLAAEHKYNCTTLSPHSTALLSAYSHQSCHLLCSPRCSTV